MRKEDSRPRRRNTPTLTRWAGACAVVMGLTTGCGGGSPFGNPPDITNEAGAGGQKLSFAYFERCINPIFLEQLPIIGTSTTNTCAGSGCHDNANGTGGAFRVIPSASPAASGAAPDVIRASDMYKNFYSAQGEVVMNNVSQSRLLTKPLVRGVLHGGGLIFESDNDPHVVKLRYWMTHPAPMGQDEFSTDPGNGTCSTS